MSAPAPTTEERTRNLLAGHLNVAIERVTDDARLADLGADSLDSIEIALLVEEEFSVDVVERIDHCETVGDVVALVRRAVDEGARP